ncbi:MAG: hypothetical protein V4531_14530 [Actinomycetota bacterium]
MARIANPGYFRAEAVGIDWASVAKSHGQQLADTGDSRGLTLRLAWACHSDLGVPHGVFTVWRRQPKQADARAVEVTAQPNGDGSLRVDWGTPAGRVAIDCGVVDPSQPVVVRLCWRTGSKESVTAVGVSGTGSATAHIELRTPGATCALVTNAFDPVARIVSLDDIVNAPDWEPLEYVGLPVPNTGIAGTDYDGFKQGLVTATMPAQDAALDRWTRGAPPVGWSTTLPSGFVAPTWQAPDAKAFVARIAAELLDRIAGLYAPGLAENAQAGVTSPTPVAGPPGAGQPASIDAAPWPLLSIPAVSDPFANLALGFGTAYPFRTVSRAIAQLPAPEFLVTAKYAAGPVFRASGPGWNVEIPLPAGEYAAYAPPVMHAQTPGPLPFVSARYSLQPPTIIDAPWRENVRSTWPPLPADAGTVHVTQFATVRTPLATGVAEPLFAFDADVDGWRVPNIPPLTPGATLLSSVDPVAEIPLGGGGRHELYGAALSDVHGIWSPWSETVYSGVEPAATPPMLANLKLRTTYTGSVQCPATLDVDVIVEFTERSTTSVEFSAVFYPMTSPSMPPPTGLGAEAVPVGAVRRSFSISFAGDVPTGIGCAVVPLDENGLSAPVAGPGQGEPRRFGARVGLPPLDFSTTDRWGVDVWARRALAVGPTPTVWSPSDPARAMLASVGSPVPVVPATMPLPGVPLASLPDSNGRAHVRVVWGAPGSSSVKAFVVWQASEDYLRERCGIADPAPDVVPGARLVAVRQLLIDHPEECRLAFRRMLDLPGDRREEDVALARGSTGIQFFVVTSTTPSGVDSAWPYNSAGHDSTQVFIAPRVLRPAQPLARPEITLAGADVGLEVPSEVPVSRFRVYRTHNFDAARRADSMGAPEFVTATAPADPPAPADVDLVTGQPVFRGHWVGALTPSWKTWYVRTVAEPDTSGVPERGWRGILSPESDIVTVRVPPSTPPDLDPLVVESVTPDHSVLVARTSTSAPIVDTDFGPHLAGALTSAALTADGMAAASLAPLSVLAAADPPAPAVGVAVVVREERSGGRTPLAVWFTRADPAQPVDVGLRLVDPLGRAVVQLATVAGWTTPTPPNLELVAVTRASATAAVVTVSSTEERTVRPPFVLSVSAARRIIVRPPLGGVGGLGGIGGIRSVAGAGEVRELLLIPGLPLGPTLTASIELPAIRRDGGLPFPIPFPPRPPASGIRFAFREEVGPTLYDIYIPLAATMSATVTLTSPEGPHTSVRATG